MVSAVGSALLSKHRCLADQYRRLRTQQLRCSGRFRVPAQRVRYVGAVAGYDHVTIDTTTGTPVEIFDYIDQNGDTFNGSSWMPIWACDTRNRVIFPTSGSLNQTAELAVPGSDAEYYKLNYRGVMYPFARWLTWSLSTDIGYGDGCGNTDGLPFFENFTRVACGRCGVTRPIRWVPVTATMNQAAVRSRPSPARS